MKRIRQQRARQRRGAILPLTVFLMLVMLVIAAFALDLGMINNARTDMQRAVDAGALAGAGVLGEDRALVEQTAREYVQNNSVDGATVPDGDIDVEVGHWDANTRTFTASEDDPMAVRVRSQLGDQPMFFARVLGRQSFTTRAEAVATYRPRDIVVVLDYSASMNDDSELKHIPRLGRAAIEDNIREIYDELGAPAIGNLQFNPVFINSTDPNVISATLGLTNVAYPYPQGSWNEYYSYVQNNGSVNSAGYRKRYGFLTLINYWLESRPMFSETPDLWRTSEQPITALKNGFTVFLSFIQEAQMNDRVGLAVYTAADGTAVLESGLTTDMTTIETISRERQAGHYDHFTNISAGMQKARVELQNNGRAGAQKMMVLMTDGIANRPSNTAVAKQRVRQEAQLAADAGFPIVTISLGIAADVDLMQEVADVTSGVHFNVPGGRPISEMEEDLKDVFREIAGKRPLQLVE